MPDVRKRPEAPGARDVGEYWLWKNGWEGEREAACKNDV